MTVLAVVGTLLAGVSAYAIYFDHKRRTDPDFRRLLRRDQKKLAQLRKDSAHESAQSHQQSLKAAHKRALADELPSSPEDRENAFMQEVAKGETLYARGESMRYEAAICFYRALKMYPQPAELTRIYQQTIPPVRLSFRGTDSSVMLTFLVCL